jgi:hypothetical protein
VRYTTLRVTGGGILLWRLHLRRLAPRDQGEREAVERFASAAEPGVYSVWLEDGRLGVERRPGSRLRDGIPTRVVVSPVAGLPGPLPKPRPPCVYDGVRMAGVATLLTSADGTEFLEGCAAAVVGWDGHSLVVVPEDRPRVVSLAETAVRAHLSPVCRRLPVDDGMPLLLVNAVRPTCQPHVPGRPPFPVAAREAVERVLVDLARDP